MILVLIVAALVIAVLNPLFGPTGLAVVNESNTSNSAPVWVSNDTSFPIAEGSFLLLNLSQFFIDPDNDSLSFIVTQPSNFTVNVSFDVAVLTPDKGFTGTRSFSVIASDEDSVSDQTILVDVFKSNETVIKNNDKFYGKKLTDEPLFETRFVSIEQDSSQLTLIFYHDSSVSQPVWIEGDIDYNLSTNQSEAYENVTLVIGLVEGIVPKFKLHVGSSSEVFEFGKNIPDVFVLGGEYELIDRDDELLDVQIKKKNVSVRIKGTDNSKLK